MTLDEAINLYEKRTEELYKAIPCDGCPFDKCKEEYRQLAEWLKELKELRDQTRWIPCSERLPEEHMHVLCQFTFGGMGECYLAHGRFHIVVGYGMTCNEVMVMAWMPLPKPYKAESEADFPQSEDIEPTVKGFAETMDIIENIGKTERSDAEWKS